MTMDDEKRMALEEAARRPRVIDGGYSYVPDEPEDAAEGEGS